MSLKWFCGVCLVLLSQFVYAGTDIVRFVDASGLRKNPNNRYFIAVLDLALQKSQREFGDYILQPIDIPITQKRHFVELSLGRIDVFWTMASSIRETFARPVPVPLAFGSYGIRLMAINKQSAARFGQIKDIVGLNEYSALSGVDWPDTEILKQNGIVTDASHPERDFYHLLSTATNYYFPRGITEIYSELERSEFDNLVVDEHLALIYPAVMYFYVANDNFELQTRLEKGLKTAIEDGSLEELFFKFDHHKKAFEQAYVKKRNLIFLPNPLLPNKVDIDQIRELQMKVIGQKPKH
ncbi:hypothetical protein [Pseudoalteromonas xiamenensis]|uniref:Solute-binding protein family 3/N-terminal domain-containing protein n=1 Tax=Pseudoalteromonas xiamenensis TaxID=882626 RepID=A0A975HPN2_9GAMM|nr:hypothetical protein [Pseudoalteromonas xiamenensis]QTH73435.1 hypothetical protein J5O05_18215 [Pseudoalteromonas xiamenensis]